MDPVPGDGCPCAVMMGSSDLGHLSASLAHWWPPGKACLGENQLVLYPYSAGLLAGFAQRNHTPVITDSSESSQEGRGSAESTFLGCDQPWKWKLTLSLLIPWKKPMGINKRRLTGPHQRSGWGKRDGKRRCEVVEQTAVGRDPSGRLLEHD